MGYDIEQFETDKVSHGYMSVYTPLFESIKDCERIFEIGVMEGKSLEMFSTMFPYAKIYGMDIVPKTQYNRENISTHIGDQASRIDLERVYQETGARLFDLILDDGGHTMTQQQVSLGYLFQYVKPGGYFIVEDLHTSRWGGQWINKDCLKTSLDLLLEYNQTNKIISNYMTSEEIEYLENNIQSVEVWTRTDDMTQSVTSVIKKKF